MAGAIVEVEHILSETAIRCALLWTVVKILYWFEVK